MNKKTVTNALYEEYGTFMLSRKQVSEELDISTATLSRWGKRNLYLKYKKHGSATNSYIRYSISSVAQYICEMQGLDEHEDGGQEEIAYNYVASKLIYDGDKPEHVERAIEWYKKYVGLSMQEYLRFTCVNFSMRGLVQENFFRFLNLAFMKAFSDNYTPKTFQRLHAITEEISIDDILEDYAVSKHTLVLNTGKILGFDEGLLLTAFLFFKETRNDSPAQFTEFKKIVHPKS